MAKKCEDDDSTARCNMADETLISGSSSDIRERTSFSCEADKVCNSIIFILLMRLGFLPPPGSCLPPRQKNGILCVLFVEVATFSPPTADFLATSAANQPPVHSARRGGDKNLVTWANHFILFPLHSRLNLGSPPRQAQMARRTQSLPLPTPSFLPTNL